MNISYIKEKYSVLEDWLNSITEILCNPKHVLVEFKDGQNALSHQWKNQIITRYNAVEPRFAFKSV